MKEELQKVRDEVLSGAVEKEVIRRSGLTLVVLKDGKFTACGWARLSCGDKGHGHIGLSIAQGRAEKCLYLKRKNKEIVHPSMI